MERLYIFICVELMKAFTLVMYKSNCHQDAVYVNSVQDYSEAIWRWESLSCLHDNIKAENRTEDNRRRTEDIK